jgi:N-methylhydantoinase B
VRALAPAMPDRAPAGHHGLLGGTVVFFGVDPKTNRRFVIQSIEGGGWGGRPYEDGESGTVSVCQGDVRNGPIESIELKCPVLIEKRELRADSAGAGKNRGGFGLDVVVRNLIEGRWNFDNTRRSQCPPWGLHGGHDAEYSDYLVKLPGEKDFATAFGTRRMVPAETEVIVRTGGGGGWGDPLERDPEKVRADVLEDLVSVKAARDAYGVVLDGKRAVDSAATQALRTKMRSGARA